MGELVMFDSIDVGQLPAGHGYAYAGYVDGRWANVSEIRARFPSAHVLSIAVFADHDADCLDIETGDATPEQAAAWFLRQQDRGITRPCLYASASVMEGQVLPAIRAAGISRDVVRLWSAHYTGTAHICGPASCRLLSVEADAAQWTDRAMGGRNLDQSLLLPDFFDSVPPPAVPAWESAMLAVLPTLTLGADDAHLPHWYVRRVQVIANAIYHVTPTLAEDGVFGMATKVGVEQVQRQAGIVVDGAVGPATWGVLITGSAP